MILIDNIVLDAILLMIIIAFVYFYFKYCLFYINSSYKSESVLWFVNITEIVESERERDSEGVKRGRERELREM